MCWITKAGGCILVNNNSDIPYKELRELMEMIANNYFFILSKWKQHFPNKEIVFYC